MAVLVGSARSDERGKITGGKAGDQTGKEVSTQNWYLHSKGWVVIRAKDDNARKKIATSMKNICANDKIGYNQSDRYSLYNNVKNKGYDALKLSVNVNTDCSAAVRVCCCYAGIIVGDFNTSSQKSVLQKTGKFDILTDSKYTKSSDYLLEGDILVTASKGHTVVVLSNGAKVKGSNTSSDDGDKVAKPTIKKGSRGNEARKLQSNLNEVMNAGLDEDGDFGNKSVEALKKFQKKYNLNQDGSYGPASYNKMKSLIK